MKKILLLFILTLAAIAANAQDDFDPVLPGEPNARYKITVGISHPEAGTVYGSGSYSTGDKITIRRSSTNVTSNTTTFYKFKYWTMNGKEYTPAAQSASFTYTVGTENAVFEAVYEVEDADNVTSKVFLVAEPADACTFNTSSGNRYVEDTSTYFSCYKTSSAFRFDGWYEGDRLISSSTNFYYQVGRDNTTLTARFTFEPSIPDEPTGNQSDVDNGLLGDVDNDGSVTMADAIAVMNAYLLSSDPDAIDEKYDIDKDGHVTMADAIYVMNIYLTAK